MKVAVIGGGFSGMLAAYLLEKKGIDVTVYEKQEYIGGHCKTIVSKNVYTELGTVFSLSRQIKELLIDLQVDYTERFVYRNFVNEEYQLVEHMLREDVVLLIDELSTLQNILQQFEPYISETNYGYIPEDMLMPFSQFLKKYNLRFVSQVIVPHLSSFGFGSIDDLQAYYVFKTFNLDTINSFLKGERLLFIDKGMSELINKLSQRITDIRYSLEVTNVEVAGDKVKIETPYASDYFDKVLITTKLPRGVIKDKLYNDLMAKIDTNPFVTCVYEVTNKDLASTYYKAHLGKAEKIQFFFASRQHNRTIITAYVYGHIEKDMIAQVTNDIEMLGINIKQLVTVKQWYIFPHLKPHNLTSNFYVDIAKRQRESNICLIGSLVSKPSLDNLYLSVKNSIDEIFPTD
ncbi:MAG: FAD-dependent oxidoreductase [Epulopiscium sp.]|nr:FAD-dependent oxidoreductase [Candidatus Epulonipiscium sp.]